MEAINPKWTILQITIKQQLMIAMIDLSRLSQCSGYTKMAADEMLSSKGLGEGLGKGLTDLVELASVQGIFGFDDGGRGR